MAFRCNLDQKDVEKYSKVFLKIDQSNKGYLTLHEIKEYFNRKSGPEDDDVEELIKRIEENGLGRMDWNAFISCLMSQQMIMRDENLKEAFSFFDVNSQGFITVEDFKKAIAEQASYINVNSVFTEAFPRKTQVTFPDFVEFMRNSAAHV